MHLRDIPEYQRRSGTLLCRVSGGNRNDGGLEEYLTVIGKMLDKTFVFPESAPDPFRNVPASNSSIQGYQGHERCCPASCRSSVPHFRSRSRQDRPDRILRRAGEGSEDILQGFLVRRRIWLSALRILRKVVAISLNERESCPISSFDEVSSERSRLPLLISWLKR